MLFIFGWFRNFQVTWIITHHGNFVKLALSLYTLEIYHRKTTVFVRARRRVLFRTSNVVPGLHPTYWGDIKKPLSAWTWGCITNLEILSSYAHESACHIDNSQEEYVEWMNEWMKSYFLGSTRSKLTREQTKTLVGQNKQSVCDASSRLLDSSTTGAISFKAWLLIRVMLSSGEVHRHTSHLVLFGFFGLVLGFLCTQYGLLYRKQSPLVQILQYFQKIEIVF